MTTFFDLFVRHSSDHTVRNDPTWADRQFPESVAASPFRLWRPGDPISEHDVRYLIGVATWSGYDMRLLDVIAEALRRNSVDPPAIDVFNMADCQRAEDFASYFPPRNEAILQTPAVGFWHNGQFAAFWQGHEARKRAAEIFGSTSAEIVAFVQDWIKGRALAQ
jgi:hypothetical protein